MLVRLGTPLYSSAYKADGVEGRDVGVESQALGDASQLLGDVLGGARLGAVDNQGAACGRGHGRWLWGQRKATLEKAGLARVGVGVLGPAAAS
jgi:hypothetical protein